jgi:hypothetical protein
MVGADGRLSDEAMHMKECRLDTTKILFQPGPMAGPTAQINTPSQINTSYQVVLYMSKRCGPGGNIHVADGFIPKISSHANIPIVVIKCFVGFDCCILQIVQLDQIQAQAILVGVDYREPSLLLIDA